jgi:sugar phosphate isomerase/epimerase
MIHYKMHRRRFLSTTGLGALWLSAPKSELASAPLYSSNNAAAEYPPRRFYTVLSLGRIGFEDNFQQSVELAARNGFEGVDPDEVYFSRLSDSELERVLGDLKAKNLKLGAAGLPVEFRKDEQTFNEGLKQLPAVAKGLERASVKRVSTWILPFSDDLTYLQNFRMHTRRLRACAQVLKDHGQCLGLEYVGPRTSWRSTRHSFIHTLSETKELIAAIGGDNLGVQLDSFHWFNAEETENDLLTLESRDVITVDLNDAPKVSLDQQMDLSRELPATTGVIPVRGFLDGLLKIGYDGPIQAEPFNAALRALPLDQACAATAAAIQKAFSLSRANRS